MEEIWNQIFQQYERISPIIIDHFNGSTEREQLNNLRSLTSNSLIDLYKSLSIHDGQQGYGLTFMFPWRLHSTQKILEEYDVMNLEVAEVWREEGINLDEPSYREGPVKEDTWNTLWIPIASNGVGDLVCADLDPDEGGSIGQIIIWLHETAAKIVVAESYRRWLENYLNDLKNDRYSFSEEMGLIKK